MGIIENEKKILGAYIFFIFPAAENKKKIIIMKKKFLGIIVFGLLPNYIVKKKKFIAIQFLYCRERELKAVCIAIQYFVL